MSLIMKARCQDLSTDCWPLKFLQTYHLPIQSLLGTAFHGYFDWRCETDQTPDSHSHLAIVSGKEICISWKNSTLFSVIRQSVLRLSVYKGLCHTKQMPFFQETGKRCICLFILLKHRPQLKILGRYETTMKHSWCI